MNWIKRHKLWSLIFLYFGGGMGIGTLLGMLGIADSYVVGRVMGIFFWPYLLVCYLMLKTASKGKLGKTKRVNNGSGEVSNG